MSKQDESNIIPCLSDHKNVATMATETEQEDAPETV